MAEYSRSQKSDKKTRYKSNPTRVNSMQRPGASGKPRRPFGRPSQAKKEIKKFDPSLFIKKVEEQTASPEYTSKHTFADFAIAEQIKRNIAAKGYINPTPIQDQAIPHLLEGKDLVGAANTGTGKTAAFLIPLIHHVITKKTSRVLIIAPTRELAAQIQNELKSFSVKTGIFSTLCIGGVNMYHQIQELNKYPQFVVGTPGRLVDLEKNDIISFSVFTSIVLDEVDTMLDMGFINDMKYIIKNLPAERHSLFFSATIPASIKKLMGEFLRNPVSVSVQTRQSAENVNQDVIRVGQGSKIELLHDLLIKPDYTKSIIFLRTKHAADRLARELTSRGFKVAAIHGDKTQAQRNKALLAFKQDKVTILIATDVVARGIDIDDVSHVINYDLPQTHADYIHRIGRTGRAGKIGQAITFID